MICRYCRTEIVDDSIFCARCGKRQTGATYPRLERFAAALRLKTPYPYFAILLVVFLIWALGPRQPGVDYSSTQWSFELDRELNLPEENLFQQSLSLVLENTGTEPIREVPVELSVRIEPPQPAEVIAGFLGRRLLIMQSGRSLPLVVVLADTVEPGHKRRYLLEGSVQATLPFRLTYEVREESSHNLLASYVVEP